MRVQDRDTDLKNSASKKKRVIVVNTVVIYRHNILHIQYSNAMTV